LLLYSLLKEPIYLADVYIEDMALNHDVLGNGAINPHWNQDLRRLDSQGESTTEKETK